MDDFFEDRLQWHARRSLAGKFPRGEIAAATIYAREIIRLREVVSQFGCATVSHMTDTNPASEASVIQWVTAPPEATTPFGFRSAGVYDTLIAELVAHPGQWALVGDGLTGVKHTSAEHLKKKGLTIKTRVDPGPARDHKGRKLVRVFAAYFPPAE